MGCLTLGKMFCKEKNNQLYLLGWILVVDVWVVVEGKFVSKKRRKKNVISPKEIWGMLEFLLNLKIYGGICKELMITLA